MGCAHQNKTRQPSVSSAIPLCYVYRVGIASFYFEQTSRLQHSLQDPVVPSEYLAPDASKHRIGAKLGACTPPYLCFLVSVGRKSIHIVQMKAVVHISQLSKLGDGETGIPGHITVPTFRRDFSLPLLL